MVPTVGEVRKSQEKNQLTNVTDRRLDNG